MAGLNTSNKLFYVFSHERSTRNENIRTHLIRTDHFIVAAEVVVLEDGEVKTVQSLREVEDHFKRGDIKWLFRHGTVCQAIGIPA